MRRAKKNPVTVGFISLGCAKNTVDSERMLAEIVQAGFLISADPSQADVVIINTCGFIADARTEALQTIKQALQWKRTGTVKRIIVVGCLVQRATTRLFSEAGDVDAIVGLGYRDSIADVVVQVLKSKDRQAYLASAEKVPDDRVRLRIGPSHWAYLRISEGCNRRCSFCTIPEIRGKFRSKTPKQIIAEAEELVDSGAVELILIGQDTSYYGRDLQGRTNLVRLLERLQDINGLRWIRLMYLYPSGISEDLIETIRGSDKIVPYLDIPIQHIDDEILKKMHRVDTSEKIYKLIETLRDRIDGIVLRTSLIVGFPGESKSQFERLLKFVEWAKFDALGCFKYSPEQGTVAAQLPGRVPEDIKQQRFEQLMLMQQQIAFEKNRDRIGSTLICMVDEVDNDSYAIGRFYGQAPEIDSICKINRCSARPGEFINAKVIDYDGYDLVVEQI